MDNREWLRSFIDHVIQYALEDAKVFLGTPERDALIDAHIAEYGKPSAKEKCKECGGDGFHFHSGAPHHRNTYDCDKCKGTGYITHAC